jgi:hypothetical protein
MDEHIHRSMFLAILVIAIMISGIAMEHAKSKITTVIWGTTGLMFVAWWLLRFFVL